MYLNWKYKVTDLLIKYLCFYHNLQPKTKNKKTPSYEYTFYSLSEIKYI
jgi:hypothetical protein